jgi:hypothetical protein
MMDIDCSPCAESDKLRLERIKKKDEGEPETYNDIRQKMTIEAIYMCNIEACGKLQANKRISSRRKKGQETAELGLTSQFTLSCCPSLYCEDRFAHGKIVQFSVLKPGALSAYVASWCDQQEMVRLLGTAGILEAGVESMRRAMSYTPCSCMGNKSSLFT